MIKNALPEIPVFENLDRNQIEELSSWLERKNIEKGKMLFEEGDSSDGLYVLARGEVEILKNSAAGPLVIAELEAPTVVGEMGLLNEEARSASVRTQNKIVVGFLPCALFEKMLAERNITALLIALNLGRIACLRLRATTRRLAELSEDCARHALHAASGLESPVEKAGSGT